MPPPIKPLPVSSVEVNGETVDFRSLSRAEAIALQKFQAGGNFDEAEVFILMCATDWTEPEIKEFRDQTQAVEASKLVDGIIVLSGLAGDGDPKPSTSEPS